MASIACMPPSGSAPAKRLSKMSNSVARMPPSGSAPAKTLPETRSSIAFTRMPSGKLPVNKL
eukprot:2041472-Amphidinium_carterae.1